MSVVAGESVAFTVHYGVPTSAEWGRVGAAIKAARELQHWDRPAFAMRASVSVATILHIEQGIAKNYHAITRRKIERALYWSPGDIDRILQGGSPTIDGDLQYVINSWWKLSSQVKAIIVGNVDDALSAASARDRRKR